jgi:rare lipoprotein A (peptidoglycan hydrolase)
MRIIWGRLSKIFRLAFFAFMVSLIIGGSTFNQNSNKGKNRLDPLFPRINYEDCVPFYNVPDSTQIETGIAMQLQNTAEYHVKLPPETTAIASYYGKKFQGKKMANGEKFDKNKVQTAHRTLPLGSIVKITNPENNKAIIVPITDRGPFHKKRRGYDRDLDLSFAAAQRLGAIEKGVIPVRIQVVYSPPR